MVLRPIQWLIRMTWEGYFPKFPVETNPKKFLGYLVDSTATTGGVDQLLVGRGFHLHGLLSQAVEELATRLGTASAVRG